MPRRSCPQCNRRLPYAARRCVHCGWARAAGAADSARGRWRRGRVALLCLLALLAGGLVYRDAERLAEWYAGFAARRLPAAWSDFAPIHSRSGAFFYCARNVARSMDGEFSVETFPTVEQSRTHELGEGRYRIESFVEEARATGERVRHEFVCVVRFQRGRWVLESLRMERYAGAGSPAAVGLQSE